MKDTIYYSIDKNKTSGNYVVWLNIYSKNACACHYIFSSRSYRECRKYCNEHKLIVRRKEVFS